MRIGGVDSPPAASTLTFSVGIRVAVPPRVVTDSEQRQALIALAALQVLRLPRRGSCSGSRRRTARRLKDAARVYEHRGRVVVVCLQRQRHRAGGEPGGLVNVPEPQVDSARRMVASASAGPVRCARWPDGSACRCALYSRPLWPGLNVATGIRFSSYPAFGRSACGCRGPGRAAERPPKGHLGLVEAAVDGADGQREVGRDLAVAPPLQMP